MLMTCILTSLAGSECPGQTNQPGSEMPPCFSQGILCIDQEVVWDNIWEAAEICSCGCPQHMPAARQCRGSWSGLAVSAKHPSLCRRGAFSGVSAQRTSVGHLLPCAVALAHLLSGSSLVWWGTASDFSVFWKGEIVFPEVVPSSQGCGHWLPEGGNNRIENVGTKNYFCQRLKYIRSNNKELKINMNNPGSQQPWLPLCWKWYQSKSFMCWSLQGKQNSSRYLPSLEQE